MFKFGDSSIVKSLGKVQLPIVIADVEVLLSTDVIDRDIPLLLSKASMKKADTQINFKQDKVTMFGNDVPLEINLSGHYCIPIKPSKIPKQHFDMILLTEIIKSDSNKQNIASKLHRQFAHASSSKIKALLTDANIHDDEIINQLQILDTTCDTCLK